MFLKHIVEMGVSNIKKGCLVIILFILCVIAFFIGEFYYYCMLKRNYVKIDDSLTITIWNHYIIFERYWYPFYPKNNYIQVNSTWDYYNLSLSITQDSVLGIWCNYPIEIHGMDNFKTMQIFDCKQYDDWATQYSFTNVDSVRQDSLLLELGFTMWYPCTLDKARYKYNSVDSIVTRDFSN